VNIYFIAPWTQPQEVKGVLKQLGFEGCIPSEDVITVCSKASAFATTFRWDSDKMERVCFYTTGDKVGTSPSLQSFQETHQLPTETVDGRSFVGCSFGANGFYTKLESDYQGYYIDEFLASCINFQFS
jgi:hypothetical protein